MKFERLGDITKNLDSRRIPLNSEQRIAKSKEGLYPYIGANNIVGYIDEYIFDQKILCVAEDGGSWGTNQTCAVMYEGKTWVNNHAHVLVENGKANLDFLRCYLNLTNLNKYIKGATRGKLNKGVLENILIPLPSLSDQIQIANILSKAETLIEQRKQSIALLDEFLKSSFLEMFGDPVKNEKGFQFKQLGEVLSIKHGFAFSSEFFTTDGGEYVLLTPGNFYEEGGYRDRGEKQKYYLGEFPKEYLMRKGELLLAMTEQAAGLLGSAIIVPDSDKFLHNQRLGLVQFEKKVLSTHFLFHLFNFNSIRFLIHAKATGLKVRHTSPTRIQEISIGVPPIELQNKFFDIATKAEALKEEYKNSLVQLENLYGSLSQLAFKGELEFSKQKAEA